MKEHGVVKWFNVEKRFGFITSADGKDIFVHQSDIDSGFQLTDGAKVEYEIGEAKKGTKAIRVKVIKEDGNGK